MSYVTNNWMHKENFMQAPAIPQKVCNQNERNKQRIMLLIEGGSL